MDSEYGKAKKDEVDVESAMELFWLPLYSIHRFIPEQDSQLCGIKMIDSLLSYQFDHHSCI